MNRWPLSATPRRARIALGVALSLLLLLPASLRAQREEPRAVQREALRAVEQDDARDAPAVAALRRTWTARARADANDRAARLGLALLLDLTYDDSAAAVAYRALSDTTLAPPDAYTAYARLSGARMDNSRGARGDAKAGYEAARELARRIGDRLTEASAMTMLGYARANYVSIDAGMAALDTAARLLAPGAPDDVRSAYLRARANLLIVQAVPGARDTAELAVMLARRAGDRRGEADAMRGLGLFQLVHGFADSAVVLYDSVARINRAAHHRRGVAEALTRVANAYLQIRRLGEARAYLLEARREAERSRNFYALAGIETGLAVIALRIHDLPEAEAHLRRARAIDVAINDSTSLMNVDGFRAGALLGAGQLDSAWAVAQRVLAHRERTRELDEQIAMRNSLANIAMAQNDFAQAHEQLDSSAVLVRRHRLSGREWGLAYDRARLAQREGRDAEAAELLERSLPALDSTDGLARWDIEVRLADIEARHGDPRKAAARLTSAGDDLERWRAAQGDSTLRMHVFQTTVHEDAERGSYFAHVVARLAARGQREVAFVEVERQRARTLSQRIVEADALRAGARHGGAPSASALVTPPRLTTRDVAAALPDDATALLEYVTGSGDAPTTLFVITRAGLRALPLASADSLTPAIRYLLAAIEGGEGAGALARRLGDALLRPALDSLPAAVTRLVVVPDGALHRVPFDALRLADGRAVIERYEISVAPSAAVAMMLRQRPPRVSLAPRVLAFGDPALADSAAAAPGSEDGAVFRGAFAAAGALAPLPASGREARLAARYGTNSVALVGDEASAANLERAALDSFDVLHFATHALVDERSLMRSAVVLAPGGGHSGFVTPGDLAALRLDGTLVLLSSCRSGGGVLVDGEGVQGLTAPLLAAGARAVVATGWPIEDRETVALVEDFYSALAKGIPVGASLRSAKLAAMRRGAPVRSWASFSVVGDPLVRVPLAPPTPSRPWTAIALGALGLIGVAGLARRRSR